MISIFTINNFELIHTENMIQFLFQVLSIMFFCCEPRGRISQLSQWIDFDRPKKHFICPLKKPAHATDQRLLF